MSASTHGICWIIVLHSKGLFIANMVPIAAHSTAMRAAIMLAICLIQRQVEDVFMAEAGMFEGTAYLLMASERIRGHIGVPDNLSSH